MLRADLFGPPISAPRYTTRAPRGQGGLEGGRSRGYETHMKAACPHCGRPADRTPENPHRPFCSARCQQLDLARWFGEEYRVPAEPAEPAEPVEPE